MTIAAIIAALFGTPAKPFTYTVPELRAMAVEAIRIEGGPLNANELVAMCLVESSGNPDAIGDGGKAVGLFQFHAPTWNELVKGDRRDARLQFIAAIRYSKRAVRLCVKAGVVPNANIVFMHHNAGNIRGRNTGYAARCRAKLKEVRR